MDPEKDEAETVKWFREEILVRLLRDGCLPVDKYSTIEECDFTITNRWSDHFASSPYFLHMVTGSADGTKTRTDMFIKFAVQNDQARQEYYGDRKFYNEVNFYNCVLKEFHELLRKNPKAPQNLVEELTPKCYHAFFNEEDPKRSLLVAKNMRKIGYTPAEEALYLDYDHCVLAMQLLGRFHALSLALKVKYPEILNNVIKTFTETRFFDDPDVREKCNIFHDKCNQRGIDYLLSQKDSDVPEEYLLRFRKLLSEPYDVLVKLVQPKEPLALICHGDFCRNNILFRYENGRVVDAKVFDFQLARYGPPSLDIAFFIYLNTTQELRDLHFDDLLDTYYSSLVSTAASILDVPQKTISEKFPLQMFLDDFASHAAYAYFLVAFFQAMLVEKMEPDFDKPSEEWADVLYYRGGEKVTQSVANVIVDFYKRKFYVEPSATVF